jgi:hypothetical protein
MIVEARLDDVGQNSADGVAKGVVIITERRAVGSVNHQSRPFKVTKVTQRGIISSDLSELKRKVAGRIKTPPTVKANSEARV